MRRLHQSEHRLRAARELMIPRALGARPAALHAGNVAVVMVLMDGENDVRAIDDRDATPERVIEHPIVPALSADDERRQGLKRSARKDEIIRAVWRMQRPRLPGEVANDTLPARRTD